MRNQHRVFKFLQCGCASLLKILLLVLCFSVASKRRQKIQDLTFQLSLIEGFKNSFVKFLTFLHSFLKSSSLFLLQGNFRKIFVKFFYNRGNIILKFSCSLNEKLQLDKMVKIPSDVENLWGCTGCSKLIFKLSNDHNAGKKIVQRGISHTHTHTHSRARA